MRTAACLAEKSAKSSRTRPVTSGKRGPLSVWADPAVRAEAERLLRAGFSYPQIGIRLVRRFKVVVTDSQIYRLKKELGLAKPAPKRVVGADQCVCPKKGRTHGCAPTVTVEPAGDEPEPELPIAAEAEENQQESVKPEENGPDPIGNETDFVTSDPQHEQSTDCADCADQIRPVSEQNPPVSPFTKGGAKHTRGDLPSFSEAILSLISRETITGCQIKGNPTLSKFACLKRQVSSGKRYLHRYGNGHGPPRLNCQFQACDGCDNFLSDEDYETVQQHVKRGHAIRPTD